MKEGHGVFWRRLQRAIQKTKILFCANSPLYGSSHTIGSSEQNKRWPWIVSAATYVAHAHVFKQWLLFLLYDLFPRLTAGLRGCVNYWQRLTVITVSLIRNLSSHCWWLQASQRNKTLPLNSSHTRIVAAASDWRNTALYFLELATMQWIDKSWQ